MIISRTMLCPCLVFNCPLLTRPLIATSLPRPVVELATELQSETRRPRQPLNIQTLFKNITMTSLAPDPPKEFSNRLRGFGSGDGQVLRLSPHFCLGCQNVSVKQCLRATGFCTRMSLSPPSKGRRKGEDKLVKHQQNAHIDCRLYTSRKTGRDEDRVRTSRHQVISESVCACTLGMTAKLENTKAGVDCRGLAVGVEQVCQSPKGKTRSSPTRL